MAKLRTDGPTLKEWVEKGYLPEKYPPEGYAAREEGTLPIPPPPPPEKGKVTVRAKRHVNIDGVHLEPKAEHTVDAKRAKSIGSDLVEIIED